MHITHHQLTLLRLERRTHSNLLDDEVNDLLRLLAHIKAREKPLPHKRDKVGFGDRSRLVLLLQEGEDLSTSRQSPSFPRWRNKKRTSSSSASSATNSLSLANVISFACPLFCFV